MGGVYIGGKEIRFRRLLAGIGAAVLPVFRKEPIGATMQHGRLLLLQVFRLPKAGVHLCNDGTHHQRCAIQRLPQCKKPESPC